MPPIRALFYPMLILAMVIFFSFWKVDNYYERIEDEATYALNVATMDATMVLKESRSEVALNQIFDGSDIDDFSVMHDINYDAIIDTFYDSFDMNLTGISSYNIPVIGVATYDKMEIYIRGIGWSWTQRYSYYDSNTNLSYAFTLGDKFEVTDFDNNTKTTYDINTYSSPISAMTMEEFKNYVIMSAYNKALSWALNTEYNFSKVGTAQNVEIQFPYTESIDAGTEKLYISYQNIIHTPGVFAVVDQKVSDVSRKRLRIFSFGGAELELVK